MKVMRNSAVGLHIEGKSMLVDMLRSRQIAQHAFRDAIRRCAPDLTPNVDRSLVQEEQSRTLQRGRKGNASLFTDGA